MFLQKQRSNWMQMLAIKPVAEQYKIVKNSNLIFIKDLHKLIKYVAYDKKVKISPLQKCFLKKHKRFLLNYIEEMDPKKKKTRLLTKVKGGFLGLLIPSLISIVSSVIPALLEK